MALTTAERARRHRRHVKGDHTLCDASRRCVDTPAVTTDGPTPGLGVRGRRLWREVTAQGPLGPAETVLLEEACRLADRLDRLDEFLAGHGDVWLRFHSRNEDGSIVQVVVDKALSEARQQQATLKQLVAELRQSRGKAEPEREASTSDELARRRDERRRAAGL